MELSIQLFACSVNVINCLSLLCELNKNDKSSTLCTFSPARTMLLTENKGGEKRVGFAPIHDHDISKAQFRLHRTIPENVTPNGTFDRMLVSLTMVPHTVLEI